MPRLLIPNRIELIQFSEKPSVDIPITYVVCDGDHNPNMLRQVEDALRKSLTEEAVLRAEKPFKFDLPKLNTRNLFLTQAERDFCLSSNMIPISFSPGLGLISYGSLTRFDPMRCETFRNVLGGYIPRKFTIFDVTILLSLLSVNGPSDTHQLHKSTHDMCIHLTQSRYIRHDFEIVRHAEDNSLVVSFHTHSPVSQRLEVALGTLDSYMATQQLRELFVA